MGHRVSTLLVDAPLAEDSMMSPILSTVQRETQQHQKGFTIANIGNASTSTSSRTLTIAILLCAATSNHLSGVTAASSCRSLPSPSCAYAGVRLKRSCRSARYSSVQNPEVESHSSNHNFQYREEPGSPHLNSWTRDICKQRPLTIGYRSTTDRTGHLVSTPLHPISLSIPSSPPLHIAPENVEENDDNELRLLHDEKKDNISGRRRRRRRLSTKGRISTAAQMHYDDALLKRIMKGRQSRSPRWRKRTRHAAASFGFRLVDEEDTVARTLKAGGKICNTAIALTPRKLRPPRRKRLSKRKHKIPKLSPEQYQTKKLRWAARYTSLSTLRTTFGTNRNKFWGDFDPTTTRRLYNTLLPRALLGLYEMGPWSPNDLAPLAYEARIAAKRYARERCVVPGRLVAMLYDGYRSWRDYGTWSVEGLSWEQIYYKYETQVLEEMMADDDRFVFNEEDLILLESEEEVTAQIYLRILERSCITNERINQLLMGDGSEVEVESGKPSKRKRRNAERYLAMISAKLDMDMVELMKENEERIVDYEERQ